MQVFSSEVEQAGKSRRESPKCCWAGFVSSRLVYMCSNFCPPFSVSFHSTSSLQIPVPSSSSFLVYKSQWSSFLGLIVLYILRHDSLKGLKSRMRRSLAGNFVYDWRAGLLRGCRLHFSVSFGLKSVFSNCISQ